MSLDTTIYLMNNIDLGARPGEGENEEEKWETAFNEEIKWTQIGKDSDNVQDKLGTFEGNNFFIKGVYINKETENNGVFGCANDVQNLTIVNSYIHG